MDKSLIIRSCVHRNETWSVREENELVLQQAEMRMVRWMCDIKVEDRVPSKEMRNRLGIDNIFSVLHAHSIACVVKTMIG